MPRMNIKPLVRRNAPTTTRFEVRFVNGVWTIFDRHNYGHGNPLGTRKEADRIVAELNEGKLQWAA